MQIHAETKILSGAKTARYPVRPPREPRSSRVNPGRRRAKATSDKRQGASLKVLSSLFPVLSKAGVGELMIYDL